MRLRASPSVKLLAPATGGTVADDDEGTGVTGAGATAGGVTGAGAGALVCASATPIALRVRGRTNRLSLIVFMVVPIASGGFAFRPFLERVVSIKVAFGP